MSFIKISQTETLDIKTIRSFKASEREVTKQGGGKPDSPERERVLTLTKKDGQDITLLGDLADAALAILRLHGF